METINISREQNQIVIKINENELNFNTWKSIIDKVEFEKFVEKSDLDDEILKLDEKLKSEWWAKNKKRLLGGLQN